MPSGTGGSGERTREAVREVGEPADRLQAETGVQPAMPGELVLGEADHPQRTLAVHPTLLVPPAGGVELPTQQRGADALPSPPRMHTAGQVDPSWIDVERDPPRPPVRHGQAAGVTAEDRVDLGIGIDLVEAFVQFLDAVPLDRLVEMFDGGQQAAQLVEIGAGERLPKQPMLRRSAHAPRFSPSPVRGPRPDAPVRSARSWTFELCRPPSAPESVPRFSSNSRSEVRPPGSRRFVASPTTTKRPPRSGGAPRRATGSRSPPPIRPAPDADGVPSRTLTRGRPLTGHRASSGTAA